jgi:hypothetical protein
MHRATIAVLAVMLGAAGGGCSGDPVSSAPDRNEPDPNALEYVTPEDVGFSSAAL